MEKKNANSACAVIIVTHNSQPYLATCLAHLKAQTRGPDKIIIVDSGSLDTGYLKSYAKDAKIELCLLKENIGFCQGNNIGFSHVAPETNYVLFLNPDAFLWPSFISSAISRMENIEGKNIGVLSGILLGYNLEKNAATGLIDSSGIFRSWYGKWYDRDQGKAYSETHFLNSEQVPAICGALMFCRMQAIQSVCLAPNQVMDESFFMYKEDIDLSLRLRKKGWVLVFDPKLKAFHCRGWSINRAKVPRVFRLMSAKNEMRLNARLKSPYYFYSALKYFAVKLFDK
ncbi:MAG: glycosyltransferase family 2 protein [Candidatus Protochlamydia sp.]|nr:glycosyltransferase family 2 protein [Candidatus Protochlamydia sp.]